MFSFKGYTLLLEAAGRAWVEQPGGASLSKPVCCSFGPGRRDRGSICSPKSCSRLKTSLYTRKPLSGTLLYLFFLLFFPPSCGFSYSISRRDVLGSLVAQWIRICLPMQETRVRSLVWEDPMCCGATKPQLLSPAANTETSVPKTRAPQKEKPTYQN